MIILGDIASPSCKYSNLLKRTILNNSAIFDDQSLICNLEGLILENPNFKENTPVLYNHISVIDSLLSANIKAVGLANNHTQDLPQYFEFTLDYLNNKGISYCGASTNNEIAYKPTRFKDRNNDVILFNACWDFLLYNHKTNTKNLYIATIKEIQMLDAIEKERKKNPYASIVVLLHWSLDLEILPYPMYRQFAKSLIDKGVNIVAGAHSHCVQGGEKYKDGYIIYGLGNFFIPHNMYAGGKLSFPEMSDLELALEWDTDSKQAICHWFEYKNEKLEYLKSEKFEDSKILKKHSPFKNMNDKDYLTYFKNNRRKGFLIPVYKDYNNTITNKIYTIILKSRARFARLLARIKLRKWQN